MKSGPFLGTTFVFLSLLSGVWAIPLSYCPSSLLLSGGRSVHVIPSVLARALGTAHLASAGDVRTPS